MIGIVDVDLIAGSKKRFPNLASMKISGFWKNRGEETKLVLTALEAASCDRIYASKVFTATQEPEWLTMFDDRTERGGTGYYLADAKPLPDEIEHTKPDYELYAPFVAGVELKGEVALAFTKAAIGFTTRGCFRQCPFCVNRRYKRVVRHSPVAEFDDPTRTCVILLDDNIFGFAGWREVFDELKETNKSFVFKQGMDMRLMTKEKAVALQDAKYHKEMIFALDQLSESRLFADRATIFREHCSKPAKCYVLTGYYEQGADAFLSALRRVETLSKFEILPYVMRYERCYTSPLASLFSSLAAWTNQPRFFRKMSFAEFVKRRAVKIASEQLASVLGDRETFELVNKRFMP